MPAAKPLTRELTKIMVYHGSGPGMNSPERATAFGDKVGAPADMLRYNHAFESPRYPGMIVFVCFKVRGSGTYQGWPIVDRWRSFSVLLTERKDLVAEIERDLARYGDQWHTSVHPVNADGLKDYARLEPQSFDEFFHEEVRA